MMKKLELAANIAIVLLCLVISVVVVKRYVFADKIPAESSIHVGEYFHIPGVDWSRAEKNIVMALSSTCHFCSDSAPFYRRLADRARGRSDVKLIAVLPQSRDTASKYVEMLGLSHAGVHQIAPMAIRTTGTPTLLLVDRSGKVKKIWRGRLDTAAEQSVLGSL